MHRTWKSSTAEIARGRPGDGAELPLLHPRLLLQLSNGEDGRGTCIPEGDCLILSEDGLSSFDAGNVREVREALSAGRPTPAWPAGNGITGRRLRWKRMLLLAVCFGLAIGAGVTIGWVF